MKDGEGISPAGSVLSPGGVGPCSFGENNERGSTSEKVRRPESQNRRLLICFSSVECLSYFFAWCVGGYKDKTRDISEIRRQAHSCSINLCPLTYASVI